MWNVKAFSKVISKFKVLKSRSIKLQGQSHRVKIADADGKVPSLGILVKNQSSSTHCSKVISKVKVSDRFKEWQNDRKIMEWQNDRQDKNNMPPIFDLDGGGHD